ncbi:MAG TPA: folate-binding protein YgfZ [Burkholderiales bacterium]
MSTPGNSAQHDWDAFLEGRGAVRVDGVVAAFGDPEAAPRDATVLVDLSHFSIIRAAGPDAAAFLNGQLTCDVHEASETHSLLGAWCSPKGRMLAVFRLWRAQDAYLLQLPRVLCADTLRRLRMYVLRAKVTLDTLDDTHVRFGVAGPRAAALLEELLGTAPTSDDGAVTADGVTVLRIAGAHARFALVAPFPEAQRLWAALERGARPAAAAVWDWHDIAAGIPVVLPATSDKFLPQEANLELLGGVSFTKGCYVGQEIVARVHYRGRVKQRMYRAHVAQETAPAPGEPIYAPELPDQASGTVVLAAPAPEGGYGLLAVIYSDRVNLKLCLGSPAGTPLSVEALPYAITDAP